MQRFKNDLPKYEQITLKCDHIELFCVENKIDVMAINKTKLDPQINDITLFEKIKISLEMVSAYSLRTT